MRLSLCLAGVSLVSRGCAIDIDISDDSSIRDAASTVAYGLMKYYTGNNTGDTPGNLPDPYYWWEAGAMFGTLIDYWYVTGDTTYNNVTSQAMLHQAGDDNDFMPTNQTRSEGNDDQGFWALAAMSAAENVFPNPPSTSPQWLALAQAVFNEYVSRWETSTCNGGLRWQIFQFNNGFFYKNAISNGCFFNLAARLARYTSNQTYAEWAERVYDWETQIKLITPEYEVVDGASMSGTANCSDPDTTRWSYNAAIHLHGAAVMYNYTDGNSTWKNRVDNIWNATYSNFFNNSIMYEAHCEEAVLCDVDQQSFKGYLARWMYGTAKMAPYMFSTIKPLLQTNAKAAATACTGTTGTGTTSTGASSGETTFPGIAGTGCGFKWTTTFDNKLGVGEQMNALSVIMYSLLNETSGGAVTASSGGTSQGDPDAGSSDSSTKTAGESVHITTGSRVGAGFLTVLVCASVVSGGLFVAF